jgi:hypothetical protein
MIPSLLWILTTMLASSSVPFICCKTSKDVQNAMTVFCKEHDTVLELGAELGDVSAHLCRTIGSGGKAVMVDKQRRTNDRHNPTSGRTSHRTVDMFVDEGEFADRVSVLHLEDISEWRNLIPVKGQKDDIIVLSVGHILGHDLYMTMLSLASEIIDSLDEAPRNLIIKSKALYSLSRRLVHAQRLFDGTTVLPADIKRSPEPYLIAGVKVDEYRRTIPHCVRSEDAILEVGCHFGRTTALLNEAGNYCIGVDIGPKIIDNARNQYPDIPFAVGDAWRTLDLLKLKSSLKPEGDGNNVLGYDVVYADIGGLSGADGHLESLSLLDSLGNALEPRVIVIKSLCMRQLASRLRCFGSIWRKYNN